MTIQERIKLLRKIEMFDQREFAKLLCVNHSLISHIERGKHKPTKRFILNICQTFGVNRAWLENEEGEMYDKTPRFTAKGGALIEAIYEKLISADRKIPLSLAAKIVGVDPDNPSREFPMPKEFWDAIYLLVQIFEEGNKERIDAVMSLFKALKPPLSKKEILEKLKEGAM